MTAKPLATLALACALCGPARADVVVDRYADYDAHLSSGVGVAVALGGGVLGFTDRTLRDNTSPVGGTWDLRATFGTHFPIALEVAYVGSANQIQSLFNRENATLIGTTLETDVRLNALPHYVIDPYVFVGIGWQRYDLDERDFSLADTGINQHDDMVVVPVGAGISYRLAGLVADLRGTFRATSGASLVLEQPAMPQQQPAGAVAFAPMHAWNMSLSLGYYF